MPPAPDPLDALMAQLADGDRSVFREVFQRLWPPIERLCTRLLQSPADAADAAQEALQKILERAPVDYDRGRPALPWALAIAGWECRTLARKRERRRETSDEALRERATAPDDVEEDFARRELSQAALEALGQLSDVDRETLLGTFWEQAAAGSPAAGSRGQGPSAAAVRKRRERALTRLRSAFWRLYGLD